ncbi:MAG: hypothetical protein PHG61_06870 [Candidatus Marinimicrobia bacterium]|nr:hypothetical protein [Candidatus Neomarinimicrobiota bacterium]
MSGLPDWTIPVSEAGAVVTVDTREVAARLGAVSRDDKRGEILWYTNFEDGLSGLELSHSPTTRQVLLNALHNHYGRNSLHANFDAASGASVYIYKRITELANQVVGFESAFTDHARLRYFILYSDVYTGSELLYCGIRYYHTGTGYLQLYTPDLWVNIAEGVMPLSDPYLFTPLKVVVDFSNRKYVRAIFGENEYDLSAYSVRAIAAASAKHTLLQNMIQLASTGTMDVYVSHYALTKEEPL